MDYQFYLAQTTAKLLDTKAITLDSYHAVMAYQEVFKWRWFATKLKIFSFVAYTEAIHKQQIEHYSSVCLDYARKNKKGLPIGFQNGIVSNNILVSESVDEDAISFVTSRPNKHFSVFEMPIIVNLSKNDLYYYKDNIIWGSLYHSFVKEYIEKHFDINGQR